MSGSRPCRRAATALPWLSGGVDLGVDQRGHVAEQMGRFVHLVVEAGVEAGGIDRRADGRREVSRALRAAAVRPAR